MSNTPINDEWRKFSAIFPPGISANEVSRYESVFFAGASATFSVMAKQFLDGGGEPGNTKLMRNIDTELSQYSGTKPLFEWEGITP